MITGKGIRYAFLFSKGFISLKYPRKGIIYNII
jgi:hypothetical protein